MIWGSRLATVRRVGIAQVLLARTWIILGGDAWVREGLNLRPGDLLLDVGAYRGEFVPEVRSRFDVDVIAVEPVPEFADLLETRFANDDSVVVVRQALGREDGQIRINLGADGSSTWAEADSGVEVPLVDVAQLVGERTVGLLKMNAEGAEFDTLERLIETGQISQIRDLLLQFHRFAPGAVKWRRRIRRALKLTHRCSWSVPWVCERWSAR